MTRRVLKTSCGLQLLSQSQSTLIDPEGKVIQQALVNLAGAAIGLKRAGNRVVVAVGEPPGARDGFPGDQVYTTGYAARVVAQTKLMSQWQRCFDNCSELAAQVLVDAGAFYNTHSARQLAALLIELTDRGIVPLVGLSAAGRGVGSSLLDTFLINLLETPPRTNRVNVAV